MSRCEGHAQIDNRVWRKDIGRQFHLDLRLLSPLEVHGWELEIGKRTLCNVKGRGRTERVALAWYGFGNEKRGDGKDHHFEEMEGLETWREWDYLFTVNANEKAHDHWGTIGSWESSIAFDIFGRRLAHHDGVGISPGFVRLCPEKEATTLDLDNAQG